MTLQPLFSYFGILLALVVPALAIGLVCKQRLAHAWIAVATVVMIVIQYWELRSIAHAPSHPFWVVFGLIVAQWCIARVLVALRGYTQRQSVLYGAVLVAAAPALIVMFEFVVTGQRIGIGFLGLYIITFRALDVLFSIGDNFITRLSFTEYISFIAFFPTIGHGPIDRYPRFHADWERNRTHSELFNDVRDGVHRIFRGLLYAFIIAPLIQQYWLPHAAASMDLVHIASFMYAYAFYLFFVFAGYSSFSIGTGYLFGIHMPENFNSPFLARNIRDYWNRWNISLTWWFRDHLYSRFVHAAIKGAWFRDDRIASYIGYTIVMVLMGFIRDVTWTIFFSSLYFALLLIGYDIFRRWNKKHNIFKVWSRAPYALSIFLTFNAISFGLLLFSGHLSST
ncbi:hypothetical protein HY971_02085 [Candidatus Kaiserbacteria bacterium]|nr:hypothetical protein [Candidatus Kaiserbacteria bacterium]